MVQKCESRHSFIQLIWQKQTLLAIGSLFVLEIFLGNFFQHFIPAGLTCQVQSGTKLVLVEKKGRESYLQEGQDFSPLSLQVPHMRSPSGH